jgi:hypothetical protein
LEKDKIVLIVVSIALGAILGFSMSYMMYDNQIATLEMSHRELQNTTNNLQLDLTETTNSLANTNNAVSEIQSQLQLTKGNVTSLNVYTMALNNSLQDIQDDLDERIDSLENQKWHLIVSWEKDARFVTEPFFVQGTQLKIKWWMTGDILSSRVIIRIYFSNDTFVNAVGSSGYYGSFFCEIPLDESGYYYLDVSLINLDSTAIIALYEYY